MNSPPQDWAGIERIFFGALDRPPQEREAWVREAAAGDAGLEEQVRSLLRANDEATAAEAQQPVGPYRLERILGRGGMGEVWLACRADQQYEKKVAIKLVRPGIGAGDLIQRFLAERQILADLQHPNIATLLDGGLTQTGQPYLVMAYVEGTRLDEYCDGRRLSILERLELFTKVCAAVNSAHQHMVIHRDLKPGNILVTAEGEPKLLDFGIAKVLKAPGGSAPGGAMEQTVAGGLYLTPLYASPELLLGRSVTAASDVYSLGVILYELLCGMRPHDSSGEDPADLVYAAISREPQRPSSAVGRQPGNTGATAAEIAALRATTAAKLQRMLEGDLDGIALRALAKTPEERYGSAEQLSSDIRRYLTGQPVSAIEGTRLYIARKYIRRHRVGVGVAAAAAVLLVSAAVVQTFELRRTRRERDRADRVTEFMSGMFKVSDPSEARGNDIRAHEILDKASKDIDTGLAKDPELQAQMMHVMGNVYKSLGLYSKAESLLSRAVEIRRRTLAAGNTDTLKSMHDLAGALNLESRYPEAEKLCRETMNARRRELGSEHRDTLNSMSMLASILSNEGRNPEAEKLHRGVVEVARRVLGPQDQVTLTAMLNLAIDLAYEGKYLDAEKAFRDVLEIDRGVYGSDHPKVLRDLNNLAATLLQERRYAEAEKLYTEVLQAKRRVLGPEHPDTLLSMGNLASVLRGEQRYAEAEKLLRETLEIQRRRLGPEHHSTLITMGRLARVLTNEGRYSEAEQLVRQSLETERRTLGPDHSDTLFIMQDLGDLLKKEKRYSEAEKAQRDTLEGRRRALGPGHPDTASTAYDLACVLALEGKRDEAFANLRFAVEHELPAETRQGLEKDADLKSLHGDPRFASLVTSVRQGAAALQKAN
jgi:serine/threonine protein kinase/tetratricopeptide (TPR) repeat protein